jgi:putative oxidoreductase
MNKNFLSLQKYNYSILPLLIRLGVGIAFLYHGIDKVMNIENVAGFLSTLSLGGLGMAWFLAIAEIAIGISFILGVFTFYTAILAIIIMIVAIVKVHFQNGYSIMTGGYEYQLLLLLGSLGIIFSGPGRYSVWYKKLSGCENCECGKNSEGSKNKCECC